MRKDNWPVTENAPCPAGKPDLCCYCQEPVGGEHKPDCVLRQRSVVLRMTIEFVDTVPEFWSEESINSFKNESRDCINNSIDMLHEVTEETGRCVCGQATIEYVREATERDEELMVGEPVASVGRY